ncbi:MAG: fibronectin type III domain-containing protein [Alistipes sp.]|nr:fibronectin type III domain-containing protein [Alistipes sp.]
MKINRKLIAAFAMLSVVFGACTTDQTVDCGIKSDLTAPSNVVWDEYASTKTALAFTWDASAAIAAGATSFTAQVVKPNMETMGEGELHDFITPDQYDSAVSVVLPVTTNYLGSLNVNENDAACDQVVFNNIQNGKQYMLRVRANYPNSNYSEWQWVMDDITSEVAHIKPGKGLVDPTEADDKNPPVVKITDITAADAIVLWSVTDFKSTSADFGMAWTLTLKKGNDLVVRWNFPANAACWTKYSVNGCSFKLTALEPETEYNVLIQNVTEGTQPLEVTKFTTAKSQVVVMPEAPAAAGDVILYEDFSEFFITADLSRGAAGYSYGNRDLMDAPWIAGGDDPVANDDGTKGCYLVDPSTEVGLFNTIKKYVAVTRLNTWGMISEDESQKGTICARSSHIKMGASSTCAWLVLPEIKCLQQTATVEFSFDAALYDSDPGTVIVEMLTGCTQLSNAENSFVRPSDRMTVSTFNVGKDWTRYTFTVDNVNNGARLAIGGNRNGVSGQHRFYLDNIEVKVVSYGDLKLAAPKNVVVNPTDSTAEVLWDKVNSAEEYVVEYTSACDLCGQPVWKALPATTATKVEIEGLAFETEYAVRVKAVAGEVVSEYCEPVSFTTLAEIKKLKTPKDVTVVAGLGAVELSLPAVTKATNYEVYAAEALVASSFVESADKVVTITVAGLTPDTDYSFAIKATADGTDMESSDLSEVIAAKTGNITALRTPGLEYKPTSLTIEWTDFRADHAYNVQLADAEGVLGAWNVTIKASTVYAGTSTMIPARFTFGALTPATEYTVSVKAKDADDATYGTVKFTTDAVRPAGAKDVYWNGFDDCFFGGDGHNVASAVVSASGDALKLIDWPATTRYIYENVVSKTAVDGPGDANRTSAIQSYATADPECSLYGWKLAGSEVHSGFLKVGAGGTIGTVTTNVLGDKVLNASSTTACTISFKVSPRSDSNPCNKPVKVEVVHEDGTTTLVAAGLEVITDGDSYGHVWRTHTLSGVQLKSTDKIRISGDVEAATGNCRFHLDDLLVVAE